MPWALTLDTTAFGNQQSLEQQRQTGRVDLERHRQQNRLGLEGVRQDNRMGVRGAPTYRDLNLPAPRARGSATPAAERTATGANGQKIFYRGGRWVDAQGRPVG